MIKEEVSLPAAKEVPQSFKAVMCSQLKRIRKVPQQQQQQQVLSTQAADDRVSYNFVFSFSGLSVRKVIMATCIVCQ